MGKAKRKHHNKKVSFKTVRSFFLSKLNRIITTIPHFHLQILSNSQKHKRRKKIVKLKYEEPDEMKRAPHSFVIHRGNVGKYVLELEKDFRRVMDPYTASQLQVQPSDSFTLKCFLYTVLHSSFISGSKEKHHKRFRSCVQLIKSISFAHIHQFRDWTLFAYC